MDQLLISGLQWKQTKRQEFKNSPLLGLLRDAERVGAPEEFGGASAGLCTVGQAELQQTFLMHLVEQFKLGWQLMGFLPFGGELGALLVIIVIREFLTCVWVPAKGPESIQVDLVTHGGSQSIHQDTGAEALWRQLLGFPVAVEHKHNTTKPV